MASENRPYICGAEARGSTPQRAVENLISFLHIHTRNPYTHLTIEKHLYYALHFVLMKASFRYKQHFRGVSSRAVRLKKSPN